MITLAALVVATAVALPQMDSYSPAKHRFSLAVEVESALESGPLAVKVTLRYLGDKPIDIQPPFPPAWFPSRCPSDQFHVPMDWIPRKRRQFFRVGNIFKNKGGPRPDRLQSGATRCNTYYLHHDYERIPAGLAQLRVEWSVYAPAKRIVKGGKPEIIEGALLAKPSTTITVNIPKATPANIRALRRRLEQALGASAPLSEDRFPDRNPRHEQAKHLAETLRYCPHEALFPLVLKLIALPDSGLNLSSLIRQVYYDNSPSPQKAHALFRDYLLGLEPAHAAVLFSFWEQLNGDALRFGRGLFSPWNLAFVPVGFMLDPALYSLALDCQVSYWKAYRRLLPKAEVERLKQARNVWVRALTWMTFPRRCERPWVEALKADLRRLNRPIPAAELSRLLGQLDSPRFPVRERAAAELLRVGDGAAPALRKALKQPLGLELRRRIERLLEDIDGGRFDPLRYETLAYLASKGTPESRAVLQTLAEGLPQARLTKEAIAAQQQGNEYRPRQAEMLRQQPLKPELKSQERKK